MADRRVPLVLIVVIAILLGAALAVAGVRDAKAAAEPSATVSFGGSRSASASERPGAGTASPRSVVRERSPSGHDVSAFAGLGAWVDAFDYAPAYDRPDDGPQLVPADVDAMAAHGVRTLFIQAARPDELSPKGIVDRVLVGDFLVRAHRAGVKVVGWYLPKFGDVEVDLANLVRLRDFRTQGQRFDGLAVDIEYRAEVPDPAERNRRVIELSQRLRQAAPGYPLGAIVYPPVLLDQIEPGAWPGFPWRKLAPAYDVWLPMAYWTEVSGASGYRDVYHYAEEASVDLRSALGDASALVHLIGGVADVATSDDVVAFRRAVDDTGVLGWSLYDYRTTSSADWDALRGVA